MNVQELHDRLAALIEADKGHLVIYRWDSECSEMVEGLDQYADGLVLGTNEGYQPNIYFRDSNYDVPDPAKTPSFLESIWSDEVRKVYMKMLTDHFVAAPLAPIFGDKEGQKIFRKLDRCGVSDGRFGSGGPSI
jgi:hypothetical protein